MATYPRIVSLAAARPPYTYTQASIAAFACEQMLGPDWPTRPAAVQRARQIERLFAAATVEERQGVVEPTDYYRRPRTTGERMQTYGEASYALGREALDTCLRGAPGCTAASITDLAVVSCTGYVAPGLDILLARDLKMRPDVRRVMVGHMGCFAAIVGLRQCIAALREHPEGVAALLSVELSSLHFAPADDQELMTLLALFGDGAAALLLTHDDDATGPQVVDTYCLADFTTAEQMAWLVTDSGFRMELSLRVPVTLRRNVRAAVEGLLTPHGLCVGDIAHWLVHPGGPAILDAIAGRLELGKKQMALSRRVLREHGNCSSATVLLILDELLRSGETRPGEWGVMMAFGPGLTLETCLLRF